MAPILETLLTGVTTASAAETQALAAALAAVLPPDTALALHGNLGAGKTTFVQGLARAFGVTEPVTSPTFNLYTIHRGTSRLLLHLDAYRLNSAREADDLLLDEFLTSPWCLAVEWPEKIAEWLPAHTLHLDLGLTADNRHTIRLRR